ncbi:hypothetical protein KR044_002008 [Drosophila immigrans]|nr:hypothetical protein KR044_002008 [Drosophila immigrans]
MSDILETLFDDVLSSESILSVAQRLGNFNASLTQLSMANSQMMFRTEVELDSSANTTLLDNLRQLMNKPNFSVEVDPAVQGNVCVLLSSEICLLFMAKKVCLRKANDIDYYLHGNPYPYTNKRTQTQNYGRTSFYVRSVLSEANNKTQFAFRNSFWSDRYVAMYLTIQSDSKVVGGSDIDWWHVKQVQDGVAIYDAATSSRVICGGDPAQRETTKHYAYTRRTEDFDEYRDECTWSIEDCSHL